MKNTYYRNKLLYLRFLATLLVTVSIFIIHSCKKENQKTQQQTTAPALIDAEIPKLKTIYASAVNLSNLKVQSTGNGRLNFIRTLDVDWSSYTLQKRRDSSIVAEFEMKNDTGLFIPKKLNLGDTAKFANRTTVTFLKLKNGNRVSFFTKIIEDLSTSGKPSLIRNIHYMQIPATFTGSILYYSLDLQYLNGFHYTNGILDGDISATPVGQTKTINSIITNDMPGCTTYDVYETYCDWGGTAEDPYQYLHGCGQKLIDTYTVCSDDDGSSGGGVAGGGASGGTGSTSPCSTPAPPPTQVESISGGRLVINYVPPPTGGGGSGGGSTTPCPSTKDDLLISNATPVKPCALKFANITSNWMAVGVQGYKFGIKDNVFGTKFITFNLQIGMPSYVSKQQAQNATAAAMLVAEAYIAQNHGVDFFLSAGAQVTYSKEFAAVVQAQLITALGLPGVQVSNSISAGVPIITAANNNCDINPQ